MSLTLILSAIAGVGAVATLLTYILKTIVDGVKKSEVEQDATIDQQIAEERKKAEDSGRPV